MLNKVNWTLTDFLFVSCSKRGRENPLALTNIYENCSAKVHGLYHCIYIYTIEHISRFSNCSLLARITRISEMWRKREKERLKISSHCFRNTLYAQSAANRIQGFAKFMIWRGIATEETEGSEWWIESCDLTAPWSLRSQNGHEEIRRREQWKVVLLGEMVNRVWTIWRRKSNKMFRVPAILYKRI